MRRSPNKDTPVVRLGKLWRVGKQAISLGTPAWYVWLATAQRFYFEDEQAPFTARHEQRQRGGDYWFGYHRAHGKLHNLYLGRSSQITKQKLEAAAAKLHNKVLDWEAKVAQNQNPDLPPIARLTVGDLAVLRPGYAAAWTNKRRKRRFDDGELVAVAAG